MDTDADNTELAHGLSLTIARLARQLRSHYRHSSPLTLSQLSVLNVLDSDGPLTPGQLATAERVQAPSMTRMVQSLEELGMISRTAAPWDGRLVILALTDAGHQALDNDRQARESWLDQQLKTLTDYERDTLTEATVLLNQLRAEPDNQPSR